MNLVESGDAFLTLMQSDYALALLVLVAPFRRWALAVVSDKELMRELR